MSRISLEYGSFYICLFLFDGVPVLLCFPVECAQRHAAATCRLFSCNLPPPPLIINLYELGRQFFYGTSQMDAAALCHSDSLPLALADVYPFVFCYEGKNLQDDVAEECSHQVFSLPRIEQRHIENHNVNLLPKGILQYFCA